MDHPLPSWGGRLWLADGLLFQFDTYIYPSFAWLQPYFKLPIPSKVKARLDAEENSEQFVHLFDLHHAMMENFMHEITAVLDAEVTNCTEEDDELDHVNGLYEDISSESTDEFLDCVEFEVGKGPESIQTIDWWSYGNSTSSPDECFHDSESFCDDAPQTINPRQLLTSTPKLLDDGIQLVHWGGLRWEEDESIIPPISPLLQEEDTDSFISLTEVQGNFLPSLFALCQQVISSIPLTEKITYLPSSSPPSEVLTPLTKDENHEFGFSVACTELSVGEQIPVTLSTPSEPRDDGYLAEIALNNGQTEESNTAQGLEARCEEVAGVLTSDVAPNVADEQCSLSNNTELEVPLKELEESQDCLQNEIKLVKRKKFSSIEMPILNYILHKSAKQVSPELPRLLDLVTSDPKVQCSTTLKDPIMITLKQQATPNALPSLQKTNCQEQKQNPISEPITEEELVNMNECPFPPMKRIPFRLILNHKVHVNYLTQRLIICEPVDVGGKARIFVSSRHIDFNVKESEKVGCDMETEKEILVPEEKENEIKEDIVEGNLVEPKVSTRSPSVQHENETGDTKEVPKSSQEDSVEEFPAAASVMEGPVEEGPDKKNLVWRKNKGKHNKGTQSKQKKKERKEPYPNKNVNERAAVLETPKAVPPPCPYRKQKSYLDLTAHENTRVTYCHCFTQTIVPAEPSMVRDHYCLHRQPMGVENKRDQDGCWTEIVNGEVTVTEGVMNNGQRVVHRHEKITMGRMTEDQNESPPPLPPKLRHTNAQKLANLLKPKTNPLSKMTDSRMIKSVTVAGYQYSTFQPMKVETWRKTSPTSQSHNWQPFPAGNLMTPTTIGNTSMKLEVEDGNANLDEKAVPTTSSTSEAFASQLS